MFSIRQIRFLQYICRALLVLSALLILVLIGVVAHLYTIKAVIANMLTLYLAYSIVGSGVLLLIIRRVHCPVCSYIFVGKSSPELFTDSCKNCGRRSGDEG